MARPRTKQYKPHDYDRNPKRYLWSYDLKRLMIHFPENYVELYEKKQQYHRAYYQKHKLRFNMKRRFNKVLKELMSKF